MEVGINGLLVDYQSVPPTSNDFGPESLERKVYCDREMVPRKQMYVMCHYKVYIAIWHPLFAPTRNAM